SSGIVVYVAPHLRQQALSADAVHGWLTRFVLATFASVLVVMNLPINHADFAYAPSLGRSALLLVAYLAAIVPFFVGGLCVNLILLRHAARIGELYFADLAGAALGCVAAVLMLSPLVARRMGREPERGHPAAMGGVSRLGPEPALCRPRAPPASRQLQPALQHLRDRVRRRPRQAP